MSRFDYVIFDLDGTLLDTHEGVISAAVQTIKEYGKAVPSNEVLEGLIGPPIQVSFQQLFDLSDDMSMRMANRFRDIYKTDEFLFRAAPYQGIYELMRGLNAEHIKIGIATYKREDYAKRLLCKKGFDKYTKFIYGSDLEGKLKKQDIIRTCLNDIGCADYTKAVYIGDGKSDGKSANVVGVNFIAVLYGFGFKKDEDAQCYNPYGVVNNSYELIDILKGG